MEKADDKIPDVTLTLLIGECVRNCLFADEDFEAGLKKLDQNTEQEKINELKKLGQNIGTKVANLLSKNRNKLAQPLDIVKYVCKDLWSYTWGKNADRLRTNYEEMYQIEDNKFKWIFHNSQEGETSKLNLAILHLASGYLKGALKSLNLEADVVPNLLPQEDGNGASFTVNLLRT